MFGGGGETQVTSAQLYYQKSPQDVLKLCIYFIPLLTYNTVSHLFFGLEGFQFSIICCKAVLYTSFYSQMQWLLLNIFKTVWSYVYSEENEVYELYINNAVKLFTNNQLLKIPKF